MQPAANSGVIFVIALIVLVAVGTLGMILVRSGRLIGQSNQLARERRSRAGVKRSLGSPHQVMSRPLVGYTPDQPIARHVNEPSKNTLPAIAKPGNVVNERLTVDAAGNAPPAEQSDRSEPQNDLQYRERLAALAILVNAGITPQAEGIERLFDCTRSGRKDSKYAQIRADLLPLLKSSKPHYPTPLTPEQGAEWEARRQELELDH
jgi:hypothetical protein